MTLIEKIKVLLSIRKPAVELVGELKDIKRGWKTFPFWLSILSGLGTIAAALVGYIPATTGILITIGIALLYNIIRSLQKAAVNGIRPALHSTEFWIGVGASLSSALIALQSAGIQWPWVGTAAAVLVAVMGGSQIIGASSPEEQKK